MRPTSKWYRSPRFNLSRKLSLLALICLCLCLPPLHAVEIEIRGNKRTKTSYLQRLVRNCEALRDQKSIDRYTDNESRLAEASRQLRECLLKREYFETVMIDRYDKEKIIVTVRDQWTFLIFPNYRQSQETADRTVGLFLFDANLAGIGHGIGLAYNRELGSQLDTYFLIYQIPYLDKIGRFGLDLILVNSDTRYYSYEGDEQTFGTNAAVQSAGFRLNHKINNKLALSYGYASAYREFDEGEYANGTQIDPTLPVNFQRFSLGLTWDNTNSKYYFNEGSSFQLNWEQQLQRDNARDLETQLTLESSTSVSTYKKHSLRINTRTGWRSHVTVDDYLRIGDSPGARGIPGNGAWGQTYTNLALDYQMPLVVSKYAYWTVGPFTDLGYLWNTPHHTRTEIGYAAAGFASYVYLNRVNIPALGFFYSFNNRYENGFFSFYLGFAQ